MDANKIPTNKTTVRFLVAIFILFLGGIGYWAFQDSSPMSEAATTSPQNDYLKVGTPEIIRQTLRDLRAPLVLVNFWASWCGPCKDEFPSLLAVRQKFEASGLRVVLVSVDEPGDFAAAQDFLRRQGVEFQSFYKGAQSIGFFTQLYPSLSGAVPATVLFGPDLKILDAWDGDTSAGEFESRIRAQLQGS